MDIIGKTVKIVAAGDLYGTVIEFMGILVTRGFVKNKVYLVLVNGQLLQYMDKEFVVIKDNEDV